MNPKLKALQDDLQALIAEGKKLDAEASLDTDQMARLSALPDLINAKRAEIDNCRKLSDSVAAADQYLNGRGVPSIIREAMEYGATDEAEEKMKSLRALASRGNAPFMRSVYKDRAEAGLAAYRFGQYIAANTLRRPSAIKFCQQNGIPLATQTETINEDGGYLVPEEFETSIIVLRETFGVFRQNANVVPMGSDTKWIPRRTGGLTAYFVAEGAAITESKAGWDRVQLIAKSLKALAYTSTELDEDALISLGDTLAGEMAYAFANKEDECGFNGDGTSTYGHINGVRNRLLDVFTTSGGTGLVLASGNAYSEITLSDLQKVQGALPVYAEQGAAWFCHKSFWSQVLMKLALAAGGVPAAEIMMGGQRRFLGDPVVISQVMPSTEANSQVPIVYGSLAKGAMLGNRRGVTIAESIHDRFSEDEIAFRGTQRFDIKVHDVGATGTAGPIVGLITAAS